MMALCLGKGAHAVREGECVSETGEGERSLQTLNAVSFHECPVWHLRV